jgi:chitodextrinase
MRVANILRPILILFAALLASQALANDGPVAHWKLDEGAGTAVLDSSGRGNLGTLVGSPVWTTGMLGKALSFNGTPGMVSVNGGGSVANLQTTGMTVAAWINRAAGRGRILDKDNNGAGGWFFAVSSAGNLAFWTNAFAGSSSRNSAVLLATGRWQHVAATWDGSASGANIHLYIDGALSDGASMNASGAPRSDAMTPLTLGNVPSVTSYNFKGSLDDLRIYNRILSPAEIRAIADITPPSVPGSIVATPVSSSHIRVSWSPSTDNVGVISYRVERCTGAGCTTFTQVRALTASPLDDTGLAASTTYRYRLRAVDANSNFSAYSSIASASTAPGSGDTQAPTAPTGLSVIAASSNEIDLAWNASTDNVGVTGYVIERCQGASCSSFQQLGTSAVTTFFDMGRSASTSYTYRVRAKDAAGNLSGFSNTVTQITPATSPDCD